jgi:hypothetical protein
VATAVSAVCAAALAVAPASASAGDVRALPRLRGWVGPGFDIWMDQDSVPAGRYRLVVRDRGTIHNFHFFGPGVNKETSVPGTGKTVWRVTLSAGTYIAACVPHGSMATQLTVT